MARFSVVLSIAVVAVVALYTHQVASQVVAVIADDAPSCNNLDSSDCPAQLPNCNVGTKPCCSGLKLGQADNGSLYAYGSGKCVCCSTGNCKYQGAQGQAITPNTGSDALAINQQCFQ